MSPERCKNVLFCMIELLRMELVNEFQDWRDCDDYIFSLLDLEVSEIAEIYADRRIMYHCGSAFEDGTSPKNLHTYYERLSNFKGKEKQNGTC